MKRLLVLVCFVSAAAAAALLPAPARAQQAAPLGGVWSLNRSLSEFPADIGFNPAWMTAATREGGQSDGFEQQRPRTPRILRRRQQPRPGDRRFPRRQENYEDARRIQLVTAEARNPPARLIDRRHAGRRDDDERARPVANPSSRRQGRIDRDPGRADSA